MNQEIKARWTAALRSGEYLQGQSLLARVDEGERLHCCLGVLCELAAEDGVVERVDKAPAGFGHIAFKDAGQEDRFALSGLLPLVVQKWSGLGSEDGTFDGDKIVHLNDDGEEDYAASLVSLNDGQGYDFNRIADVIDSRF